MTKFLENLALLTGGRMDTNRCGSSGTNNDAARDSSGSGFTSAIPSSALVTALPWPEAEPQRLLG